MRTKKPAGAFASELAASVERIKVDGKEKEISMSFAMDIQMYVEKEKKNWLAEGVAKVALSMLWKKKNLE